VKASEKIRIKEKDDTKDSEDEENNSLDELVILNLIFDHCYSLICK
jgi:hypothetical protein